MPPLAILGSARDNSNTAAVLSRLIEGTDCEVVDLRTTSIAPFNYDQQYPEDDQYIEIVERIIAAPVTLFATPVYWYSYSTPMKVFIDRFSDLLATHKTLGRQLRGKSFALVTSSSGSEPDKTTVAAFKKFCGYLGVTFIGCVHAREADEPVDKRSAEKVRALLG